MSEIKFYKSPWRSVQLLLLCSIFVASGIWMLTSSDAPRWAGWLNALFFGLGIPIGLFHLFDRRPQIIINELGIFDRTAYTDFINWEVIRGAYPMNISGQKFICLIVNEEYEPSRKKGNFAKKLADFSRGIGAQELNISLGQVKVDEKKLNQFILEMIKLSPDIRKQKIQKFLLS